MTKLIPIFIDGKRWIQLSQLSVEQAKALKAWLPIGCLKKIKFQGLILSECLDFETYECWFLTQKIGDKRQPVLDF